MYGHGRHHKRGFSHRLRTFVLTGMTRFVLHFIMTGFPLQKPGYGLQDDAYTISLAEIT